MPYKNYIGPMYRLIADIVLATGIVSVFIYIFGDDSKFKLEQILKKKIHKNVK